MKHILIPVLAVFLFSACSKSKTNSDNSPEDEAIIIGKTTQTLESPIMTPEVLWMFGRIGEVELSPDKTTVLYSVAYYSVKENKGNRELFTMKADGSDNEQITKTPHSEYSAVWTPDGKQIAYMSAQSGSMQIWTMNPDGSGAKQISDIPDGINGFKFSPDGKKIVYAKEVKVDKTVQDIYPDLDKANARIITDLRYRHWDTWVDTYQHLFVADFNQTELTGSIDLLEEAAYDAPLKPFGGMEQVAWSADSKTIAYTSRKKVGREYAISTNSDIFLYHLETKEHKNISQGMMGYDIAPVFSPDGKKIAWESMERDGYESDKNRLFVMDLETGEKSDFTSTFDQNAAHLVWTSDSKGIYFISDYHARFQVYFLNLENKEIKAVTQGDHNYLSVVEAQNQLIGSKQSASMPTEIFAINKETGEEKQLTFENKHLLDQLKLARVEERWLETTDKKQMLTWVIYPPDFDSTKKYPALLYCQGGPQSSVSQFFSYRWNFQQMAANGYIVVAPNRRGVPSFGQAWNEQISGDYGGQNMKDYLTAIDALAKEPYVDENNLGAIGASYGGFSVFWLAGNHNKRFKAFIAHDGIFNLEAQYVETEEVWFANWDMGGAFWDKTNKTAQNTFANSPHKFVQNWDAPIMIIQGGKDYRIMESQAMSAFNAAVLRQVPAKFLYFPEENHWVLQPQNSILWQREFKGWLDKWLKN